jgi:hypothetical protein
MVKNFTRILVTLPFVLMTGGALADHNPGHAQSRVAQLEGRVAALEAIVQVLTSAITVSADGKNVFFDGVNVHIRNGGPAEVTNLVNGLGNLIIGYNEDTLGLSNDRTGSHNLIVGPEHSYPSFGGFVAGLGNTISGEHASVTGGNGNAARSDHSAILGGTGNTTANVRQ